MEVPTMDILSQFTGHHHQYRPSSTDRILTGRTLSRDELAGVQVKYHDVPVSAIMIAWYMVYTDSACRPIQTAFIDHNFTREKQGGLIL